MRILSAVLLLAALALAGYVALKDDVAYPLVFRTLKEAAPYGIVVKGFDETAADLPVKCYYYGDGGDAVSLSQEFFDFYKAAGFSRESLCMALVSEIRFNPETGAQLASFVMIAPAFDPEANEGAVGPLPLAIPGCFARGLPYSDCKWNFNDQTGQKLTPAQTEAYRDIGQRAVAFLKNNKDQLPQCRQGPDFTEEGVAGYLRPHVEAGTGACTLRNAPLGELSAATLLTYSPALPEGFGYFLRADGDAGGGVSSPQTIADAQRRYRPPPQVDPRRLRQVWGWGR